MSLSVAHCLVSCHSPLAASQPDTKSEKKKKEFLQTEMLIYRYTAENTVMKVFHISFVSTPVHLFACMAAGLRKSS